MDGRLNGLFAAYWSWRQTKHFMKTRKYEVSWVVVDACMAGVVGRDNKLVHKRWKIATSFSVLASALSRYTCNGEHEHSADSVLKETQPYPERMIVTIFEALKTVKQ